MVELNTLGKGAETDLVIDCTGLDEASLGATSLGFCSGSE